MISLVGEFEGQSTDGTAVTVNLTGTASGDAVYAFQHTAAGSGSAPSGYTELTSGGDGENSTLYIYRKVLTGADASVVFSAGANQYGNACIAIVLRGVDNSTPEDATTQINTGSGAPDSPSITTVTNDAWVISAFGGSDAFSPSSVTEPAGYSNKISRFSAGATSAVTCAAATIEVASAGAEDPGAWDDCSFAGWVAVSVAVRAATGITGNGSLIAQSASMTGDGVSGAVASGALAAQSATLAGSGALGQTGTGVLAAGSATLAGTGTVSVANAGALIAQSATMSGVGVIASVGTGDLVAGSATLMGTEQIQGVGVLEAQSAALSGLGFFSFSLTMNATETNQDSFSAAVSAISAGDGLPTSAAVSVTEIGSSGTGASVVEVP